MCWKTPNLNIKKHLQLLSPYTNELKNKLFRMQIKYFPVNSKNSYVVFENNDKIEELEPFMKENKLSRVVFFGIFRV